MISRDDETDHRKKIFRGSLGKSFRTRQAWGGSRAQMSRESCDARKFCGCLAIKIALNWVDGNNAWNIYGWPGIF